MGVNTNGQSNELFPCGMKLVSYSLFDLLVIDWRFDAL